MKDFLYVCNDEDRDALISRGYTLLRSDPSGSIFIFLRDGDESLGLEGIEYVETDTLLF